MPHVRTKSNVLKKVCSLKRARSELDNIKAQIIKHYQHPSLLRPLAQLPFTSHMSSGIVFLQLNCD